MDGDDGMTMSPWLLCSVFSGFEEERAKLKERTAAYEKEKWYQWESCGTSLRSIFWSWRETSETKH